MAKNEKTIQVIRELTESQIKGYGSNIIMKYRRKYWVALFVILGLWELVIIAAIKPGAFMAVAMVAPAAVIMGAFYYSARKAGNKLLASMKNQPQPVRMKF